MMTQKAAKGNVAKMRWMPSIGKWAAFYNNNLIIRGSSQEYIISKIRGDLCTKARQFNVTDVILDSNSSSPGMEDDDEDFEESEAHSEQQQKVDRFSINERFDFMTDFTGMVADGTSPSLLITGEGGLGKTHTVRAALKSCGLEDLPLVEDLPEGFVIDSTKYYVTVKGYSSAKGLYRTLFNNRNNIVVFDDCDSILKDATAINILKGALDSYDVRRISWNVESNGNGNDDLPKSFEFKGGIIFISNMPQYKIDQAIRTRAICVDLTMNIDQKIERMGAIIKNKEFLPNYDMNAKRAALEFLTEMKNEANELSFRTLISVTKVVGRGADWKKKAEYLLTSG